MFNDIGYWFLRRVLKYSAPVLRLWEGRNLKNYSRERDTFQPVFIVGPPRSGSTILYQLITNYLDVTYIDNLMNMSREAPWFGVWLSNKLYGDSHHNSFVSDHGKTLKSGLHAPNEGLFWYRWLPRNTHYVETSQISQKDILEMQGFVNAIMNKYRKPVVFKNLSFSMRLKLIKEVFPQAKIIYIKRDPVYVAQSILLARKKEGITKNKVWSIKPQNFDVLTTMTEVKHVVLQTYLIEQQIYNDLKMFDSRQKIVVEYENLCNNKDMMSTLAGFINSSIVNTDVLEEIRMSNKQKTEDSIFNEIKEEVKMLDWNRFSTNN